MILDDLRGKAFTDQKSAGDLFVDLKKFGIFLPANSTLRNYLPPVKPYSKIDAKVVEQVKASFPETKCALLAWDEIEIRSGLVFNPHTKELVGKWDSAIPEKGVESHDWLNMNAQLATHVLQLFLVSLDGTASYPFAFLPMREISGQKMFEIVKSLIQTFAQTPNALRICATSSDAFISNQKYLDLLEKKFPGVHHFFDPLHLVKNLRNSINESEVTVDRVTFNLMTLENLRTSPLKAIRRKYLNVLPESVIPKDTMDMAPIKKILQESVIQMLMTEKDQAPQSLGKYLQSMKFFYDSFSENNTDHQKRFQTLQNVQDFLAKVTGLTPGLRKQITITIWPLHKGSLSFPAFMELWWWKIFSPKSLFNHFFARTIY